MTELFFFQPRSACFPCVCAFRRSWAYVGLRDVAMQGPRSRSALRRPTSSDRGVVVRATWLSMASLGMRGAAHHHHTHTHTGVGKRWGSARGVARQRPEVRSKGCLGNSRILAKSVAIGAVVRRPASSQSTGAARDPRYRLPRETGAGSTGIRRIPSAERTFLNEFRDPEAFARSRSQLCSKILPGQSGSGNDDLHDICREDALRRLGLRTRTQNESTLRRTVLPGTDVRRSACRIPPKLADVDQHQRYADQVLLDIGPDEIWRLQQAYHGKCSEARTRSTLCRIVSGSAPIPWSSSQFGRILATLHHWANFGFRWLPYFLIDSGPRGGSSRPTRTTRHSFGRCNATSSQHRANFGHSRPEMMTTPTKFADAEQTRVEFDRTWAETGQSRLGMGQLCSTLKHFIARCGTIVVWSQPIFSISTDFEPILAESGATSSASVRSTEVLQYRLNVNSQAGPILAELAEVGQNLPSSATRLVETGPRSLGGAMLDQLWMNARVRVRRPGRWRAFASRRA